MKRGVRPGRAAAALLAAGTAQASETQALAARGKALIGQFAGALKAELKAAVDAGGPVEAIRVCSLRAPEIADTVSAGSGGCTVARSSHRLRNPANAPDAYAAAAIEAFLARQAAGEPAADLVKAEIVTEDGRRVFRMVKAIPTARLCLNCHGGDEVAPETAAALAELYPEDQARGFVEGEMRGVFTLTRPLD